MLPAIITNPPFIKARWFHASRIKPVQLIVIHSMEAPEKGDTAEAVARYFQRGTVQASAHYSIDNNSVVQCVFDSHTAFHCKNANSNGIGIEHAGYAKQTKEEWLDGYGQQMLELSAQIGAHLCIKFRIPVQRAEFRSATNPAVVKPGFCGHADVPLHGTHWDPGKGFPWDFYLERVRFHVDANWRQ